MLCDIMQQSSFLLSSIAKLDITLHMLLSSFFKQLMIISMQFTHLF